MQIFESGTSHHAALRMTFSLWYNRVETGESKEIKNFRYGAGTRDNPGQQKTNNVISILAENMF